jgi:hypothetical protein
MDALLGCGTTSLVGFVVSGLLLSAAAVVVVGVVWWVV